MVERLVTITREVPVPKEVEYIVRVPKIVYEEVVKEIIVPVIKEQELIISRPKFVEKIVEVIKPKYVCQKCGHEVA